MCSGGVCYFDKSCVVCVSSVLSLFLHSRLLQDELLGDVKQKNLFFFKKKGGGVFESRFSFFFDFSKKF